VRERELLERAGGDRGQAELGDGGLVELEAFEVPQRLERAQPGVGQAGLGQ